MEVAWRMETSITRMKKTVAVVKNKVGKTNRMTIKDCQRSLRGKCFRCGDASHISADCPREKATCNFCGKEGHFSRVCFKKMMGAAGGQSQSQSQGRKEGKNRQRKEKTAKVSQSAPVTPVGSDTEEEEGEESTTQPLCCK